MSTDRSSSTRMIQSTCKTRSQGPRSCTSPLFTSVAVGVSCEGDAIGDDDISASFFLSFQHMLLTATCVCIPPEYSHPALVYHRFVSKTLRVLLKTIPELAHARFRCRMSFFAETDVL